MIPRVSYDIDTPTMPPKPALFAVAITMAYGRHCDGENVGSRMIAVTTTKDDICVPDCMGITWDNDFQRLCGNSIGCHK